MRALWLVGCVMACAHARPAPGVAVQTAAPVVLEGVETDVELPRGEVMLSGLNTGWDLREVVRGERGDEVVSGQGSVDIRRVWAILQTALGPARRCYERALLRDASLGGRVLLAFTLTSSGRAAPEIRASGLARAPEVVRCLTEAVAGAAFPRPEEGALDLTALIDLASGR